MSRVASAGGFMHKKKRFLSCPIMLKFDPRGRKKEQSTTESRNKISTQTNLFLVGGGHSIPGDRKRKVRGRSSTALHFMTSRGPSAGRRLKRPLQAALKLPLQWNTTTILNRKPCFHHRHLSSFTPSPPAPCADCHRRIRWVLLTSYQANYLRCTGTYIDSRR